MGFQDLAAQGTAEQQTLLKSRNFSLRPLGVVGHLNALQVLSLTWQPILAFVFTLLVLVPSEFRAKSEELDAILWCVGVTALLIFPTIAIGVLVFGIVATKMYSRVRWSAVVYWTWWPFWKFALCVVAACVGTAVGNHLWYHFYYPHMQLQRLQAYQDVSPQRVTGVRLQDAGIVTFNQTAGVDRTRIGCLKNGATYCVAPILQGGEVANPMNDTKPDMVYDFFMAGINCCSCPGEFRCGDWNKPGAQVGGLRITSGADRQFFRLAAEDWSASHRKMTKQPIFFEWVSDPVYAYDQMVSKANDVLLLALFAGPLAIILLTVILNGFLGLLCEAGVASPIDAPPVPPVGLGHQLSARFLPHMHKQFMEHQQQDVNRDPTYLSF